MPVLEECSALWCSAAGEHLTIKKDRTEIPYPSGYSIHGREGLNYWTV